MKKEISIELTQQQLNYLSELLSIEKTKAYFEEENTLAVVEKSEKLMVLDPYQEYPSGYLFEDGSLFEKRGEAILYCTTVLGMDEEDACYYVESAENNEESIVLLVGLKTIWNPVAYFSNRTMAMRYVEKMKYNVNHQKYRIVTRNIGPHNQEDLYQAKEILSKLALSLKDAPTQQEEVLIDEFDDEQWDEQEEEAFEPCEDQLEDLDEVKDEDSLEDMEIYKSIVSPLYDFIHDSGLKDMLEVFKQSTLKSEICQQLVCMLKQGEIKELCDWFLLYTSKRDNIEKLIEAKELLSKVINAKR